MTLTPKQDAFIKILASIVSRMIAEDSEKENDEKLAISTVEEPKTK